MFLSPQREFLIFNIFEGFLQSIIIKIPIFGHNADPIPENRKIMRVYHITLCISSYSFWKIILFNYSIIQFGMSSYSHLSSKWLQYWDTEPTGEIHIHYCRELDTETKISLGDFRKKKKQNPEWVLT